MPCGRIRSLQRDFNFSLIHSVWFCIPWAAVKTGTSCSKHIIDVHIILSPLNTNGEPKHFLLSSNGPSLAVSDFPSPCAYSSNTSRLSRATATALCLKVEGELSPGILRRETFRLWTTDVSHDHYISLPDDLRPTSDDNLSDSSSSFPRSSACEYTLPVKSIPDMCVL